MTPSTAHPCMGVCFPLLPRTEGLVLPLATGMRQWMACFAFTGSESG